jgi:putative membrane-bound dehydrogenase-like protein
MKSLLHAAIVLFSFLHLQAAAPPADVVAFAGLSPQEACDKATLPPGFKMHVFAAEPDVQQPIAFCLDDRGRVWVAEGRTYPKRKGHPPAVERQQGTDLSRPEPGQLKDIFGGADRILVLEDTDGDHKFDKRTVFLENVNLISGMEIGFGGVWIGAAPYLLHVPVKDWDNPKPSGDPRILLDGWNYSADTHETLNTFVWGPDGWLYGCHGVFCPSNPGKPGTPAKERQWVDAGVWRYHPTRHVLEVFTEGGSNPWGIDFDEHGQLFAEMCVIPHFWHMIQGARIERQGGEHFTVGAEETRRYRKGDGKPVHPHIYEDIKQHGDHVHWAGAAGPHAGNARSDAAGGGHAHAGVMCYLGESWPAEYRGRLFLGNIHGQRLNMDIPVRAGSGYVGKHGNDFLNFNDRWSQTLNQLYDQDGSMFIIDWYDKNQCHHGREDGHDRSNGRIYKIVYNNQKTTRPDVAKLSDEELVKLVPSKNEFMSRHARRVLQERFADITGDENETVAAVRHRNGGEQTKRPLLRILKEGADTAARLRALWALHVTGGFDARTAIENLKSADEWIRAWTIQLGFESQDNIARLMREANEQQLKADPDGNKLAESDPSPVVRRFLASAAQRGPSEEFRAGLVKRLLSHDEDSGDHNLPLMYWFAMEPLAANQPSESLSATLDTKLPKILNFTTRRVASLGTTEARDLITAKLGEVSDTRKQLDMLAGLGAAVKGQRNIPMPSGWDTVETKLAVSDNAEVRTLAQTLSLTFGSQKALAGLRKTLGDASAPAAPRRAALDALVGAKDAELGELLRNLLRDPEVRGPALRALAGYNDAQTPEAIIASYGSYDGAQKRDALNTLVSRPSFAKPLLSAIGEGKVSSKDLTADIIRQLRGLKDDGVQQLLTKVYGAVREASADKKAEIEKYRKIYAAGYSQPGDGGRGRVLYNKVCAQCHVLFDVGGKVGPDITGANRSDLNYLLETILDPNAVIPNEYRTSEIETKDGRSLTGVVKVMGDKTVLFQTANELLTLAREDIASQRQTELSMMPEGLLAPLSDQEVRDLIYYVTRPGQVPLPEEKAAK